MTGRCVVGITARRLRLARLIPEDVVLLGDATAELHISAFGAQVARAGGLPCPISWDAPPVEIVESLDALILTGGEDVDPATSGAPGADVVDPARDAIESGLLAAALARGLPVLGVCRGLQLLAVHLGGRLGFAPPGHDRRDRPFGSASHVVHTERGSIAARLYGAETSVNSVHRQAISALPVGLQVVGRAPDGTIEAVVAPGRPVLGVQWHPEFHEAPDPAFGWLVDAGHAFDRRSVA